MKELRREFAVFGNFVKVNFETVLNWKSEFNAGDLIVEGAPEINAITPIVGINVPGQISVRPQLSSAEKKTILFFGTSRINIVQNSPDTQLGDFRMFIDKIIELIFNDSDYNVNRLALNGNIEIGEFPKAFDVKNKFFKDSDLYSSFDEIQFRINSCIFDATLNNYINRIITVANAGETLNGSYDFNTRVLSDRKYNREEIDKFMELAFEYRQKFFDELV